MPKKTRIYTDGGCTGNPGPGGWAAVILSDGHEAVEIAGGDASTTNNRMELTAVIEALRLRKPDHGPVELITDSQYVQKGISEWMAGWLAKQWKTAGGKPVKNRDLWMILKALNDEMDIEWSWVKGHAGHRWNERCDELVAMERKKYASGPADVSIGAKLQGPVQEDGDHL